jgi:hypothetical protein
MTKKKSIVAVAAVLVAIAGFVGAKVYASVNPSCEPGEAKPTTSNPSLTFCTKTVWVTPAKPNH